MAGPSNTDQISESGDDKVKVSDQQIKESNVKNSNEGSFLPGINSHKVMPVPLMDKPKDEQDVDIKIDDSMNNTGSYKDTDKLKPDAIP